MDSSGQKFEIRTVDDFKLGTTFYAGRSESLKRQTVLVSGATGVPQRFYARFSRYLADAGYDVVTFDFRTVGDSPVADIRRDSTTFLDWGGKDIKAMVRFCNEHRPNQKIKIIGHSGGAWLLAINSTWINVSGVFAVASGSLYWKHMTSPERYRLYFLWKFLVPAIVKFFGYAPAKMGLGVDLTKTHAEQWARWSLDPNGAFGDPEFSSLFSNPNVPITAVSIYDDPWITRNSTRNYYGNFTQAKIEYLEITHSMAASKPIGHFGFFKESHRETLWPIVRDWLDRESAYSAT